MLEMLSIVDRHDGIYGCAQGAGSGPGPAWNLPVFKYCIPHMPACDAAIERRENQC